MSDKPVPKDHQVDAMVNFRNSLKASGFYSKSTEELKNISTSQREAVDALLEGLSATASLAYFATESEDYKGYDLANSDLQKLSRCMTFTAEILHCFLYNSERAELALHQRGESK